MIRRTLDWLDDRSGYRAGLGKALDEPVVGGASFAYVFGSILTFIFLLQAVTGVLLALYYSPSATDAWGSVAHIQDQVVGGWFIRGLHSHGASAMVIVCGLHMLQTALYGAYKKPRELNWIVGVLMLGLVLAFALTGYLLPWDQTGYWATKVATGIAGTSPVLGEELQHVTQGGNEYGNLTLTRFYALHVLILPVSLGLLVVVHIFLFRRHRQTPPWWLDDKVLKERTQPFWPDQLFKDTIGMAVAFAALVGLNLYTHGVGLDAPADPASNFDARPEWYFRPLFQALKYFEGSMETVVALGAPVVVGAVLLGLPFVDRSPSRCPKRRLPQLALLLAVFAGAGALTWISFAEDAADERFQEGMARAEERADKARVLAREYGVPARGGAAIFTVEPGYRARQLWHAECAGCHDGAQRSAPFIAAGYGSRDWLRAFLLDPQGEAFFGPAPLGKMQPVDLEGNGLAAVVELIYRESGAEDADDALADAGRPIFDESCAACHSLDWNDIRGVGPNLARRGSAEQLIEFIAAPGHERFFGGDNAMPAFGDELNAADIAELADQIVGLRALPLAEAPPLELATPAEGELGEQVWERSCSGCHQGDRRLAPQIDEGYNSRDWIRAFLAEPAGDRFFGPTGIDQMSPVEVRGDALDALVEWIYAQSGAGDADAELAARGRAVFEAENCSTCHAADGETEDEIGPNLGGRGGADMLEALVRDPGDGRWFGDQNEMPAFADRLSDKEIEAVTAYVRALQNSTPPPP